MLKKLYIVVFLFSLCSLLSACNDSNLVTDFEKTRNYFNKRTSTEIKEKLPTFNHKKWYSWQIDYDKKVQAPDETKLVEAIVVNVVDGDTVDLLMPIGKPNGEKEGNWKREGARLILVNTPESKGEYKDNPQPYALQAYNFTKQLIMDRKVWLEKGIEERDKYGRLLVYIWLDQVSFQEEIGDVKGRILTQGESLGMVTLNELLLREGLAKVVVYEPNTKYINTFRDTQEQAKLSKIRLWSK